MEEDESEERGRRSEEGLRRRKEGEERGQPVECAHSSEALFIQYIPVPCGGGYVWCFAIDLQKQT